MKFGTTFYLSRVVGNTIYTNDQKPIGKLLDMIVDLDSRRPKVIAIKIKNNGSIRIIDFSNVSITKKNQQYHIQCTALHDMELSKLHTLFLVKHVLDKQIVDMYGRKVVRVNDLRLVVLSNGTYTVAVDVGFEGFLRRLGVAKPLKELLKPFRITVPSNLLLWDEVEAIDFTNRGIKLSKSYAKLSTLHPSDLADILEDLDRSSQLAIFSSLDDEKAADVLEELETEVQVNVLESLSVEKAADMLEKMPADEVADILEELEAERANKILIEMEKEASAEVRELMGYPEKSVGSLMTTDFISFHETITVQEVFAELRRIKPEPDSVYYLYVVDHDGRLAANVSLRDLVVAEPEQPLHRIMNRDVISVYDDDDMDEIVERISKYNLLAIPVIDRTKVLVGTVIINDVFYDFIKSKRRK
ncbi:CBS domain-containing protein [Fodinisporobacter ferrooxydans]|uniref:CBS domain-containing protein n=1 Tax=Fodinisporobacter ferrooxydans TaxID=2901836 RepID=A0ABY4CR49_9BACL|nr:CBS domain-containing protein [Alicyclobacillaceae bacterium MYW30-H2]